MGRLVKLKELAEVITGFPFKGDQYSDTGIKTIRGENVTESKLRWDTVKCWNQRFAKENDYLLKPDDIVIGMDGSKVGRNKARVTEKDLPLLLAQRVACVRAKEGNDQVFLYYLINNPRFEEYVFKIQTGSSVPHISKTQIENYKIPKLGQNTQQKIASILSALDDKIELNNRINTELEQMAQTLYDYWFVQFDFPNKDGKPYKSSGGRMVYNRVLKREIPEGWEVKRLSEVSAELIRGISPKYTNDSGIPVINQRCIRNNTIDFSFSRQHDVQIKSVKKMIELGDVLVNSTGVGTLGRVAVVKRLENPRTTIDSHVTMVRADVEQVNRIFLGITLLYKQAEIETLGEGSTGQTELSRENLGKLKLLLPQSKLQTKFGVIINSIFKKMAVNEFQNKELSALRDWLLPMLMNGQVKVEDHYPAEQQGELPRAAEPKAAYEKLIP